MPAHPKPAPKAKKPGAMRKPPKPSVATTDNANPEPAKPKAKAPRAKATVQAPKPAAPEGQSKTEMLVAMLSTPGGATSKEMEAATGWKPHSVRGLLGTLRQRGVKVVSKKIPKEPTVYRIVKAAPDHVGDVV